MTAANPAGPPFRADPVGSLLRPAALRQAFATAAALPALRAQADKESLPISFISGADLTGQVATVLADDQLIAPYVSGKG